MFAWGYSATQFLAGWLTLKLGPRNRPQDGSEPYEADVLREDPVPPPASEAARGAAELTLGGPFSQAEFVGSTARLYAAPIHQTDAGKGTP